MGVSKCAPSSHFPGLFRGPPVRGVHGVPGGLYHHRHARPLAGAALLPLGPGLQCRDGPCTDMPEAVRRPGGTVVFLGKMLL